MRHVFSHPGFERQELAIELAHPVSEPRLVVDGRQPPRGPEKRTFRLVRDDGTEVVARLERSAALVDPIPRVRIEDTLHEPAGALRWHELLAIWLPIALLFVGGALGGFCGGLAVAVNGRVFRLGWSRLATWVMAVSVIEGALVLNVVAALALALLLG